ncbi:mechanosensitive ion channel family protein [Flavobacterium ustbae]|uniref:mechanosensitive ion channel family protein n=1 Tax=Flavobacterium ustbae TaxID=2488790 RepID=UPI000F76D2EF|nr:mechanosensitive ion channel family protein [Flavobacterium ustbae]
MNEILSMVFLGNTLYNWLKAAAIIIFIFVLIKIFKIYIFRRLKIWAASTKTSWDEFALNIIENNILPLLYISTVYFSVQILSIGGKTMSVLHTAYLMAITFFVIKIIIAAFRKFVLSFIQRDEDSESKEKQAGGLIAIVNIIIWILGAVFLIDNMGYNVTTIVAGLGVGGIAIALAAQAVLGDLFSYFVIFFDRPFEIGDFVTVGNDSGVIEYIGIKTTRLRTLNGEQLVCSNTDLTNSRLRNFKRMERRRIVFVLGVTYQATAQQLRQIPDIVKGIIEAKEKLSYDRGHFSGFGDFSLNFEFVYYVEDPDYNVYMNSQQAVYLEIFSAFADEGIEFAYPTQTIQIEKMQTASV